MNRKSNNNTNKQNNLFTFIAYLIAGCVVLTCIAVPIISYFGNKDTASDSTTFSDVIEPEIEETGSESESNSDINQTDSQDSATTEQSSDKNDSDNSVSEKASSDKNTSESSDVKNSNSDKDMSDQLSTSDNDSPTDNSTSTDNTTSSNSDSPDDKTLDELEETGADNEISFDMFEWFLFLFENPTFPN